MPSVSSPKVPASAQPKPEDYGYDLDAALSAVVALASAQGGIDPTSAAFGEIAASLGVSATGEAVLN